MFTNLVAVEWDEWMNEWMNDWMNEWLNEWLNYKEWANIEEIENTLIDWMNELIN